MAFKKPTHDDTPHSRAPLPLPPSQLAPPPSTGEEIPYTGSQLEELKPNRTLPDMEADATSDELQVQERRTKSRNDPHRARKEDAVANANEEVTGLSIATS
jgi:hypothetical protein